MRLQWTGSPAVLMTTILESASLAALDERLSHSASALSGHAVISSHASTVGLIPQDEAVSDAITSSRAPLDLLTTLEPVRSMRPRSSGVRST